MVAAGNDREYDKADVKAAEGEASKDMADAKAETTEVCAV